MASSVKYFCTICQDDGISNRAVTWCTECEVLFCGDCKITHSKSILSKNHKTMSSEDYQKLPSFIQEISSQCRDHQKKFELYCSFHDCPCCVQCSTDEHQKCQDLKSLSDILKQVKSSASVQIFENDLKDVKENLDTAIKYLKIRISTINTQKTKAVEEIQCMRKSINDYFNNLEQDVINDLESKHSKLKLNMASILQQMKQRASQINQMQSQFTIMTQYATELQMYIELRKIEKTTSETEKYIEDLEIGDHFIEKNLEFNISSTLQSILQEVKSFGDVHINTTSSTLQMRVGRTDQAQTLVTKVPDIEQVKTFFLTSLIIPKDMKDLRIYACRILPDSRFIILDGNQKQLLLFSNDGIFIRKVVSLPPYPHDACFVRNNIVAVTLGSANETKLVDIEKNRIIQRIKHSRTCYKVASDGETLIISNNIQQSTRVNLNDMSQTVIEGMKGVERISLFQGKIYGTNFKENKVCCYDSTGEPLWTFQHQDIAFQLGITLDKNGFVYLVSRGKNSVVVVSPDGKTCKTILSEADGIQHPHEIDLNKETGMMIVSGKISEYSKAYDTVFVYKI